MAGDEHTGEPVRRDDSGSGQDGRGPGPNEADARSSSPGQGSGRPRDDARRGRQPRGSGATGSAGARARSASGGARAGSARGASVAQGPDRAVRRDRRSTGDDRRAVDRSASVAPEIPEDIRPDELDRGARSRLRTLSKQNADGVARHLVMAGRLLDTDPELAYAHAQAAVRRAGRVDVVREAAGITAYYTGRYADALRELRTVRRLNGSHEHLPLMADCERGLGRPERALAVAEEEGARSLSDEGKIELAIVVSGARLDLGDPEAALAALSTPVVLSAAGTTAERVTEARAQALEAAGRGDEARRLLASARSGASDEDLDLVELVDLDPEADDAGTTRPDAGEGGSRDGGSDAVAGVQGARDPKDVRGRRAGGH